LDVKKVKLNFIEELSTETISCQNKNRVSR